MSTYDLFDTLDPAYAPLVKRLDQAVDDVTDAIDSIEHAGFEVRLFIVPDGHGRPTFGVRVAQIGATEAQSIWLGEIEA